MLRFSQRTWIGGFLCGMVVLAAVVILLRTFFVQGLVAKVETASGSMAPWLVGPHGEAACDLCAMKFVFDAIDAPPRERLDCPSCGGRTARRLSARTIAGEQVLVDRRAFTLRTPQRFEPIVFQCPDQSSVLCIKRVVGLPGEAVEIRAGDVYLNGQIARKTLAEQLDMAILVHDSHWQMPNAGASQTGWLADSQESGWQLEPERFRFDGSKRNTIRFRSFRRGKPQPLLDDYGYNQNVSRQLNAVRDVMLAFDLTAQGQGELRLAADTSEHRYEVVLSFAPQPQALLCVDGKIISKHDLPTDFRNRTSVVFSLFDQQLLLAIDGETIDCIHHAPRDAALHAERDGYDTSLSIQASGIDVDLANMRVLRDVYYTRPRIARWGFDEPYRLAPDEYFVLGDNSPISADSRSWASPGLASKRIVGKPLRIER